MAELTPEGLVIERIPDIRESMESATRDKFGASLPLGDQTVLGHMIGLNANAIGLLNERLEQVVSSQDPDKATGAQLRALCLLTGTVAPEATPSTTTLTLCGDDLTFVAAGLRVAITSLLPTVVAFATIDDVTLGELDAWAPTSSYVVGDRVTNASRCYRCITAGTSAGSGGPDTTSDDITDGTVHWQYLGDGAAAIDVLADCEITGPTVAVAGDISSIQTPLAGLLTARNRLDADIGRDEITDEDLRLLREDEIADAGSTTRAATIGAIRKLPDVISCTIFTNRTDVIDGDGVPPHSFETLVLGGDDQDIVNTIGLNLPDGIGTTGNTSGSFTDSEGTTETIFFSRPTEIDIYIRMTVRFNATLYPSDGDTQIKTAIITFGADEPTGSDAEASAIGAQAFTVSGVRRVDEVLIFTDVIGTPAAWAPLTAYSGTPGSRSVVTNGGRTYICETPGISAASGGPTGTGTIIVDGTVVWRFLGNPVTINSRQIARYDTTRITVVSSAITP